MAPPAPYATAHLHENLAGPGDSRPTGIDIVQDQDLIGKLQGRVALVTGCSRGGIGLETARALHVSGMDVFMSVRDVAKHASIVDDVKASGGQGKLELLKLELDSLQSVRTPAKEFLQRTKGKCNVLVSNAGIAFIDRVFMEGFTRIMACPYAEAVDGFESQFGTNHLGHFLLFQLLKPALLSSAAATTALPRSSSRVVSVSSSGHHHIAINFPDLTLRTLSHLNGTGHGYTPWLAYGQSKTANIYLSNAIERRYGRRGLHSTSLMPGGIETPLQKYQPELIPAAKANPEQFRRMKSTGQGAATSVWAAVGEEWEERGGVYLEDCAVAEPGEKGTWKGYAAHAYDEEAEERLWRVSCELVGVEDD